MYRRVLRIEKSKLCLNAENVRQVLVDYATVTHGHDSFTGVLFNDPLARGDDSLTKQFRVVVPLFPLAANHL